MTPNHEKQYFPFPLLGGNPQQQSNNSMHRFQTYEQASSFTRPISSQPSLPLEYNHGNQKSDDVQQQFSYHDGSTAPLNGSSQVEQTKSITEDGNHGSGKWVSSKMRFMRKLRNIRSNAQQQGQGDGANGSSRCSNMTFNDTIVIRVCSDCNTTKTPLWRGGPQGPKVQSLCNACGIRQRKARKAMAAEAVAMTTTDHTRITTNKQKQITSNGCENELCSESPYKKRCSSKFFSSETNDDLGINLNRSSDVKEAARLLMALSSDIICG